METTVIEQKLDLLLTHVAKNSEEIVALRQDMVDGFAMVDERFKQVDKRFEQVDARFDRLEQKMDRVNLQTNSNSRRLDVLEDSTL